MNTLLNVNLNLGDIESPTSNGLKDIAPPNSALDGVSTKSVHWFALRATYGRERKAYEYIVEKGAEAFYPTSIIEKKDKDGKTIHLQVSRLPNIFFIHSTEEVAKSFAYDKNDLHFLRFYYNQHHNGKKEPLVVPDSQIENLKILCQSQAEDILVVPPHVNNFLTGQTVRITKGDFAGIVGVVARWHGQQRVGIALDGIGIIATAYVPSAYLERIEK